MALPALPGPLVSIQWLADHLGGDDLVVLDATARLVPSPAGGLAWLSGYDDHLLSGHVPGALFADLLEEFSDVTAPLPFTLPDAAQVAAGAAAIGRGADSTVVIYDNANSRFAARLWWLLRSYGLQNVAVLDGGLSAWRAAGLPVEQGHVTASVPAEPFVPARQPGYWAERAEVEAVLDGTAAGALVCTLPAADFRGEGAGRGHIPGSSNVPAAHLVERETNLLRSGDDLAERTAAVPSDEPVILYCAAGILASLAALALVVRGHSDVRVYDGSLNEWAADPDAPLVRIA
jgi:thiosulfate/3-mercaptopyruvate sulfurtransferase